MAPPYAVTAQMEAIDTGRAPSFEGQKRKDAEEQIKKHVDDNVQCAESTNSPSCDVLKEFQGEQCYDNGTLSFVIFGATGDLAKKMTFPALFDLWRNEFIPQTTTFVGYGRSDKTTKDLHEQLRPNLEKKLKKMDCGKELLDKFMKQIQYVQGDQSEDDFKNLNDKLNEWEKGVKDEDDTSHNRVFYLAIPPQVFVDYAKSIKDYASASNGFTRVVIEKPFGRDYDTSKEETEKLQNVFEEDSIYRIDHFIGMEMVQNLMTLRFGNGIFEPIWNRNHIESVTINFKEDFGTEGRGSYFDNYGLIRDVVKNHLMQVMTFVAMEPPVEVNGDSSIRDAKFKVLQSVRPIDLREVTLGQYEGNEDKPGYTELDDVPDDSKTETYSALALRVDNARWEGVPFILRAGKALDEEKFEVRIKFKKAPAMSTMFGCDACEGNELILQAMPSNKIFLNMNVKAPGLRSKPLQTTWDLDYEKMFPDVYTPDPYVRLLLEVLRGEQSTFVRSDELLESWKIYTPLLNKIDEARENNGEVDGVPLPIHKYKFGEIKDFMSGPDLVTETGK